MEEPIRKDDIMDFEGTKNGLQEIIKELDKLVKVLGKDLTESANTAAAAIGKLNMGNTEDQKKMALISEQVELLAAQKKLNDVEAR
jgi:HEAT repeat protein